jgi:hypothetical protein
LFQKIKSAHSLIRDLPYPYRGAISLSSDAEFFDFQFFDELMKYLNTSEKTAFGEGLGLEVTSSVFFFSEKPYNFSYFDSLQVTSNHTLHASKLRDYLSSSYIDTNHAYGDFDDAPVFTRAHAEKVLNELAKIGVSLPVFSNHGGSDNIQNIGVDADYHQGDVKGATPYHVDLLPHMGTKFVWTDSLSYATSIMAPQEIKSPTIFSMMLRGSKSEIQTEKNELKILVNSVMNDGSNFTGFNRFRSTGRNAPNLSSFLHQVEQIDFGSLYACSGALVIYQHFGVLHRENAICSQAKIDDVLERPHVYLSGFRILHKEAQLGKLWVSGLARLLTYVQMIEKVSVNITEAGYELGYPAKILDPLNFFQGLTIYVHAAQKVRIVYEGTELPILHNGPDHTGVYSVTVKFNRLKNIWN